MNKTISEPKKWRQIYSPAQGSSAELILGHILAGTIFRRGILVRCVQFFAATLLAGGVYFLRDWSGGGLWLLAALAATSAFVYIGLAIESRSGTLAILNLLAAPVLFATAYAGMFVATGWLTVSFLLHGSVTAAQIPALDKDLSGPLLFWSAFNSALALFLLMN